ncbi:hypothetical protein AALB39_13665 [Lachnospiraceae bacterium 54-53]
MEYILPQVGQKREWQRKATNLKLPQQGQANMAPITAMNHFFYILNDRITRVLEKNHFFKMVDKNLL